MIQDSGNRREFNTGAVRDIQEGKGRCDLLPLDVVADMMGSTIFDGGLQRILRCIDSFMRTKNVNFIIDAVHEFVFGISNFSGRTNGVCMSDAILEVAKHYEEGCLKYGERNWQKGIPTHCYVDSGVRHLLKYVRGDEDERHDRAFIWNMFGLAWTMDHKPELDDINMIPSEGDEK